MITTLLNGIGEYTVMKLATKVTSHNMYMSEYNSGAGIIYIQGNEQSFDVITGMLYVTFTRMNIRKAQNRHPQFDFLLCETTKN